MRERETHNLADVLGRNTNTDRRTDRRTEKKTICNISIDPLRMEIA